MSPAHTYYKGRNVKCDRQDRHALRNKLELCIDSLDPGKHASGGLVNIVTGMVGTHASVNVDDAVKLGHTQMGSFKKTWPEGFHDTIHNCEYLIHYSSCEYPVFFA